MTTSRCCGPNTAHVQDCRRARPHDTASSRRGWDHLRPPLLRSRWPCWERWWASGSTTETVMDNLNGPRLGPRADRPVPGALRGDRVPMVHRRRPRAYRRARAASPPRSSAAGLLFVAMLFAAPACSAASSPATASARRRPRTSGDGRLRALGRLLVPVHLLSQSAGIFILALSTIIQRSGWPRSASISDPIITACSSSASASRPVVDAPAGMGLGGSASTCW